LAVTDDLSEDRPEEIPRLEERLRQLSEDLQSLHQTFPFNLRSQLEDPQWVEEQVNRLKLEIVLMRNQRDRVKAVLEEFC
jgi:hypothetical protein